MQETNEITTPAVQNEQTTELIVKPSGEFIENFREAYKIAKVFSQAALVPERFQGKINDCTVAVNMAMRMNVDPLMVMQNLYVVKGKPSWSGQACMSFIKAKYNKAVPVYYGEKGTDSRGCFIKATDFSEESVEGPEVTIKMAKDEGWFGKTGSKWKTMPELMLAYRAAAFFARIYCPEVLMGVAVEGEAEDIDNSPQKAPDPFNREEIIV